MSSRSASNGKFKMIKTEFWENSRRVWTRILAFVIFIVYSLGMFVPIAFAATPNGMIEGKLLPPWPLVIMLSYIMMPMVLMIPLVIYKRTIARKKVLSKKSRQNDEAFAAAVYGENVGERELQIVELVRDIMESLYNAEREMITDDADRKCMEIISASISASMIRTNRLFEQIEKRLLLAKSRFEESGKKSYENFVWDFHDRFNRTVKSVGDIVLFIDGVLKDYDLPLWVYFKQKKAFADSTLESDKDFETYLDTHFIMSNLAKITEVEFVWTDEESGKRA